MYGPVHSAARLCLRPPPPPLIHAHTKPRGILRQRRETRETKKRETWDTRKRNQGDKGEKTGRQRR